MTRRALLIGCIYLFANPAGGTMVTDQIERLDPGTSKIPYRWDLHHG